MEVLEARTEFQRANYDNLAVDIPNVSEAQHLTNQVQPTGSIAAPTRLADAIGSTRFPSNPTATKSTPPDLAGIGPLNRNLRRLPSPTRTTTATTPQITKSLITIVMGWINREL